MAIDSIQNPFQAAFQPGSPQNAAGASGTFMGRAVAQVATPESLLADASTRFARSE